MADVYGEQVGQGLDDVVWIPECAKKGWTILSKDARLQTPPELDAIKDSAAKVFLLPEQSMSGQQQCKRYVDQRHKIARRAKKNGPMIYMVGPTRLDKRL